MSAEVRYQISLAEERLRLAMLASDCAVLDELISPELIFTNHLGQVCGKDDDLRLHETGVLRMHELQPSEMRVHAGAHLAVVSVRMKVAGTYAGSAFKEDLRYTRIWCRSTNGNWQVLSGHSCRIQEAQG
jgi:ketosteroid isomerase-like protein